MQDKAEDKAKFRRETLQLKRLERLVDVVYAIVIWRAILMFPRPTAEQLTWEHIGAFLSASSGDFLGALVSLLVVIVYWRQNNVLFGNLEATDSRHTILSILQIFFLLTFLLSSRLSIDLGSTHVTRMFESIAVLLVGITGGWGWSYAIKNHRLLLPEVTEEYALQLRDRYLAEPLTAIITIPFVFVGATPWEISWMSYPLVVRLVRRRRQAKKS